MKESLCVAILCSGLISMGCSKPPVTANRSTEVKSLSSELVFNVEGLT